MSTEMDTSTDFRSSISTDLLRQLRESLENLNISILSYSTTTTATTDATSSPNTTTTTTAAAYTAIVEKSDEDSEEVKSETEEHDNIVSKNSSASDEDNLSNIMPLYTVKTLIRDQLAMKHSEDDMGPQIAHDKLESVLTVVDSILTTITDRTATDPCDTLDMLNFMDLCTFLVSLSNLNNYNNNTIFLPHAIRWLDMCRRYLYANQVFEQQQQHQKQQLQRIQPESSSEDASNNILTDRTKSILDVAYCLLGYLKDTLEVLNLISSISSAKAPASRQASNAVSETTTNQDNQNISQATDWADEGPCFNIGDDDDESLIDDSDDESLCNKLCTFTQTQKEFVQQHWYHCYTCNMVDRVGVCSVCIKVCHKDHDVSYEKYGPFFCDCAGKENNTCMALVKRTPTSNNDQKNVNSSSQVDNSEQSSKDSSKGLTSSSSSDPKDPNDKEMTNLSSTERDYAEFIKPHYERLLEILEESDISSTITSILNPLIPDYVAPSCYLRKLPKQKRMINKNSRKMNNPNSSPSFPVDFFESLQLMNDVEFGGADILSIYSTQQIKNRLNNLGMNITCTKTTGFSIDILNTDPNMIICGVRVQVGTQDLSRYPTSIQILGRTIPIRPLVPRWYDVPLTPEESSQAEMRMTLTFGPSIDPDGITIVDSIKVYGKQKESFSWSDECEDRSSETYSTDEDLFGVLTGQDSGARYQNLFTNLLESLDHCINLNLCSNMDRCIMDDLAKNLMTSLLTVPYSQQVLKSIKSLLITIYPSRQSYNQHRDSAARLLLERLIEHLPETREAGGVRSISLLHVILVLTLDLDCDNEVDEAILKNLLHALRDELLWNTSEPDQLVQRNPTNEVKLVIMRMFSILMSKVRTSTVASVVSSSTRAERDSCWSTFCSSITASSLIESNVMDFCYKVLKRLIDYWKQAVETNSNQLISDPTLALINEPIVTLGRKGSSKSIQQSQVLDLSPFFLRQYVKGHAIDLFEDYTQLLTEMVLRIPYQIKKVSSSSSNSLKSVTFSTEWSTTLCEYLMIPIPSYIKKHVRKLLTFICGSKEKYRQFRDFHFLESHLRSIKSICGFDEKLKTDDPDHSYDLIDNDARLVALSYESIAMLVEHLKACIDIAQNRCINWQVYCLIKDQDVLSFLMKMSFNFGDNVSPIVLELLKHALSSPPLTSNQQQTMPSLPDTPVISTTSSVDLINDQTLRDILTSESLSANLAQQLINSISKDLLSRFVRSFLLETNMSSLRWQAHSLLYNLWLNFTPDQQFELVWVLWSLWHSLPKYGCKAAQFVDLIAVVTLKSPQNNDSDHDKMFCQETLNVLRQQNQLLISHPNAHIYSSIQGLVDLDSYYLESEACSVCNSPEVPYTNIKLSSIKVDSRFTTTTQIIKLVGSHTILKFSLRISDVKRSKMVKTISIYYNNRSVQSVVELKNKTGIWNLARRHALSPNQMEVKIEFALPIVACNLMIEFSEFYENAQASSEILQCPRCSTSVAANPGVCGNCGENVFQCHKCRAINYDEKDPFLCISCGFCKYARFDISLLAKPTCAVDPIENEEDRKKTVTAISNLLEKADRVYKSLMQNKPILELLLLRIHEQIIPDEGILITCDHPNSIGPTSYSTAVQHNSIPTQSIVVGYGPSSVPSALNSSSVNKAIQHLAQKYCVECKAMFEELSKLTHKVLALRRELVEFDNRQLRRCLNAKSSILTSANRRKSRVYSSLSSGSGRCYGCAIATVEHCVTMLEALATNPKYRSRICESGIIHELVNFNLKNGNQVISQKVRQLLCSLTRDDFESTTILTDLLMEKVAAISRSDYQPHEISHLVRHEIALLAVTLESDDQCWELRLRCLIKIFAFAFELKNPTVMECLLIPCLKLLLGIIRPSSPSTRRHKDKSLENIASVRSDNFRSRVVLQDWLNDSALVFEDWRKRAARPTTISQTSNSGSGKQVKPITSILRRPSKMQYRSNFLAEKYGNKWRLKCSKFNKTCMPISALPNDWLRKLLFNRASKTIRLRTKSLVEAMFFVQSRRNDIIDLLTNYLDEIGSASECAHEFYILYKGIIMSDHWRYYLALRGVLPKIAGLIDVEINHLQELEETTLNSSLSLGYSLKMLLELITAFVTVPKIRSQYKSKLVGFVLKGYLSLRKLVVQRTKWIDETQEMFLELLEGMTTGSETETAAFINVCVESIKNCHEGDIRTPIFIFERLCSTIHPEENVKSEFFVTLEKDPQQEDYLQGRMLSNPYSSNEPGIGPLMKDIKNKICQDCELLALLEDDSSMELLVSNKIISLELPVRDVYKKIWCPENHEGDAMRIIYRMRGLLGDATEEFIESLDTRNNDHVDEEQVYKMANVMSTSGGLEIMLQRLRQIDDLSPPFKPLLDVILKLFNYCTKTQENRIKLLTTEFGTIETLLNTLKLALNEDSFLELAGLEKGVLGSELPKLPSDQAATISAASNNHKSQHSPKTQVVDNILTIVETIMREASKQPADLFSDFCSRTCGSVGDIRFLLNSALALSHKLPHVSHKLIHVVPFLTLGDDSKMSALVEFFKPAMDFERFDKEQSALSDLSLDLLCIMADAIEHNENGNRLKEFIESAAKIVSSSTSYLAKHAPPMRNSLIVISDDWKDFTSRPALKYVLRLLGGLSQGHANTQLLISRECIPVLHGLEQVSSAARVGTLAENLLEALRQHPSVAEKIELVRRQTKDEKKRLAMAVREKQLGALGMKANERGQVTVMSNLLDQCLDLAEDTGLICNICREGYKYQPTKVLAIYTYAKRCVLDDYEMKPRKSYGYTTVTHFNTVHVDCHMSAVRSARSRDEWDSAALQNANTRCNGLLPIWGPQVPESAYASALARHNSYLQESTGCRDIGHQSTVHDIRLQLTRFAQERSFSEDTGGGGPQSNIHLLPYMMQTALYVLNSTKAAAREYKRTLNYLEMSSNEVLENCYELDSPYYWATLAVLVVPPSWWRKKRVQFLQRLLVCNHVRRVSIKPPAPIGDTRIRAYAYYKSALIFFGFIDSFYNIVFKEACNDDKWNQEWSVTLADYLKHNDQTVSDNMEVLLNLYQNSMLSCSSFERFFEIIRIDEIGQPNEFMSETLQSI